MAVFEFSLATDVEWRAHNTPALSPFGAHAVGHPPVNKRARLASGYVHSHDPSFADRDGKYENASPAIVAGDTVRPATTSL